MRHRHSLAPCVLDHGVLVLLDRPTLFTLQLVLRVAHTLYHSKALLPIPILRCMLSICITFIILFALNLAFPKKQAYPCTRCKLDFHHTRLSHDGLCERCFSGICSRSDGFVLRGHCIDALDDTTVDPEDL